MSSVHSLGILELRGYSRKSKTAGVEPWANVAFQKIVKQKKKPNYFIREKNILFEYQA